MDWFAIKQPEMIGIFISGVGIYFAFLILIKVNGLRTLSKMSAHDFAVTIALGSIMGGAIVQKTPTMGQGFSRSLHSSFYNFFILSGASNAIKAIWKTALY